MTLTFERRCGASFRKHEAFPAAQPIDHIRMKLIVAFVLLFHVRLDSIKAHDRLILLARRLIGDAQQIKCLDGHNYQLRLQVLKNLLALRLSILRSLFQFLSDLA